MRKTFIVVLLLHIAIIFIGRYYYVLHPQFFKDIVKPIIIKEKPKTIVKKVKRVPPKHIKKTPTPMKPLRHSVETSLELIAVKHSVMPDFVVTIPEYPGGKIYRPDVALVHIPEPPLKEERMHLWERETKIKEKEVVLESFGITELPPVGSAENPIVQLLIVVIPIGAPSYDHQFGIQYPEDRMLLDSPKNKPYWQATIGPYVVRPEEVIFWYYVKDTGKKYLSTDPKQCLIERLGLDQYRYTWEDRDVGLFYVEPDGRVDLPDLQFTVTFIGALTAQ